jgi:membrane-associated phospholipid phosphatase
VKFYQGRPWGWATLWLCFLIPMFFGTYIASLEITALREHVPVLLFEWERHIPFLAWTVVPYWSIDLFYGLSLYLCLTRAELTTHVYRLITAQAVAIPIFLLFPLRLTSTIPDDTGIYAPLFAALGDMVGKPFNLAPSLHIALLVILWVRYARHVPSPWRLVVHVWATLIGVSVMTAYQHHFFDVPTGAMLGFFCCWVWPEEGRSPLAGISPTTDPRRLALAGAYALAGAGLFAASWALGGAALWLLWPAQSLLLVALAYAGVGERLFQKDERGRISLAARALLWPYLVGARINAALWARNLPDSDVVPGVRLGRVPRRTAQSLSVVDLTAELSAPPAMPDWQCAPSLDLVAPTPDLLRDAAQRIEATLAAPRLGREAVLVCCALGLSRSAAAVATWLAAFGDAPDVDSAIAQVRAARPRVVLGAHHRLAIAEAVRMIRESREDVT